MLTVIILWILSSVLGGLGLGLLLGRAKRIA